MECDIVRAEPHLKSVLGDWGSKGDKGNASQVVPLVPLEKITKKRIVKKYANQIESKQFGI